jgi:hypothetical protein
MAQGVSSEATARPRQLEAEGDSGAGEGSKPPESQRRAVKRSGGRRGAPAAALVVFAGG